MMLNTMVVLASLSMAVIAQVPRGSAEVTLNGNSVSVEYGRPSLEGRDMLAKAPVGTVWRLGADKATTLTVTSAVSFYNMVAQKGTYSLFLERTQQDKWMLIVNAEAGQWGTSHDRGKDLMAIPLKWEQQEDSDETFTILFEPQSKDVAQIQIRWGTHVLKQNFRIAKSP